ncbi:integrin alpha-X-like [Ambystoma mexicanum]|uniref:integrin alpha-X-like n=1 Tax=Ambystoma mexicanum TaxID=8296 RepID=UPI0037E71BE0
MAATLLLLLPYASVFLLCRAFNIDTENPTRFDGNENGHFGYRVIHLKADNTSWVVISAPLAEDDSGRRTGALYRCSYSQEACESLPVNNNLPISLGLSMSTDDFSLQGLTACGPTFSRQCEKSSFLNGICYIFDTNFNLAQELRPSYQECITGVDAVILYDDSNSISDEDFRRMKIFMVDLIKSLKTFNFLFAVVQYSTLINIVFDFNYYQEVGDLSVLEKFPHTKGNTYTPSAIKYVTDDLFTDEKGARSNTNRLLITITDGASNDEQTTFSQATFAADQKQITRYAIGVGDAFRNSQARKELDIIASSKENVFQVGNFSALTSIQSAVAERIFAIEGTQQASNSSSFQRELSQGGFSAVMSGDAVTLGTVGAYDWSGGLEEIRGNVSTFINVTSQDRDMKDSYLGYAVTIARSGGEILYIAGAPRYRHVGRVVVFQKEPTAGAWKTRQHLEGHQVGSYFGAELTSVDLDGDDETDLVLIGVPLFHAQGVGGIVHVCSLKPGENLTCNGTLRGSVASTLGRFGATLASLGDVSWDGVADVAVGAPLEDDHRGAIYIYHGTRRATLGPLPSQRIVGSAFSPGLKYFGTSIHGRLDISEDGLIDIAVGSLGQALILRSRPVILVSSSMTFDPPLLPLDRVECTRRAHDPLLSVGNASICFTVSRVSRDHLGDPSVRINYSLHVDTGRRGTAQSRLMIGVGNEGTIELSSSEACDWRDIWVPVCIEDFLSPVKILMNFSVVGHPIAHARNLRPVLHPASNTSLQTEVLFEKNCGSDQVCTSDLRVAFDNSGSPALVATPGFLLNLVLQLENVGELAYGPRLRLLYPMGLSFRRTALIQSLRRASLICDMTGISSNQSEKSILCTISPSVLRENSQVTFLIVFQVLVEAPWEERARVTVQATSENENGTLGDNMATKEIPVVQAANVIVKGLESISYLNFSTKEPEERLLSHSFQVQNLGRQDIPVNITIQLPVRLESGFQWDISEEFIVKGQNTTCVDLGDALTPEPTRDCTSDKSCVLRTRIIQCHIFSLARAGAISFIFEGPFYPSSDAQLSAKKFWVRSKASITIDGTKFYQNPEESFHHAQVITEVEVIYTVDLLPIVLGSSIAGLALLALLVAVLYRVGFFKRTLKVEAGDDVGQGHGETNGQALEMKTAPEDQVGITSQTQEMASEPHTPKSPAEQEDPGAKTEMDVHDEANKIGETVNAMPESMPEGPVPWEAGIQTDITKHDAKFDGHITSESSVF